MGLTADLLPVVSNPHAVISPRSSMSSKGKTPSRYNKDRQVVGIPDWTKYVATPEDIALWSAEPDYGICVQTRLVRALDVDVDDPTSADEIRAMLHAQGWFFPERRRNNSSRFLQIFEMVGVLLKRCLPVSGGVIELLGTGQQFVACGTHPSGARYEWGIACPCL